MERTEAQKFAEEWLDAWNSHDLDRVLANYEDDFEITSPLIREIVNEPRGMLKGKAAIRAYWSRALELNPDLRFELRHVYVGVDSITIVYSGTRGMSAEVLIFAPSGKIARTYAHHSL